MLTLFSVIYGPLVVWLTDSFSDKVSASVVLVISGVLIIIHAAKKSPMWIIPLVYFIISLSTLFFGKTIWLKFGPLAISLGVAVVLSMYNKMAVTIENFAKSQRFFSYIKEGWENFGAVIWISTAWINVFLHIGFLMFASKWLWAFYVSVGWYMVFILGAVLYIYLKKRYHG
ncbi:MAG: hypothetical protein LBS26_05420 [Campylobacteraceae bacterium]|jgi:hypothetical protein|nr:hypothetical protein [Campylobacteraceae bacterium]